MAKKNECSEARKTVVRHGKLRRSSSWRNLARVALTALLVIGFSGVATAAYAVWGLVRDADSIDLGVEVPIPDAVGAGSQKLEGELNIFLAGSDTRQGQSYNDGEEGELNDVNLLLHISADHKNATVISFPRDLMVPIPSCPSEDGTPDYYSAMSEQQLNSAMMYGGLPCAVRTVSELTGMEIPYAAVIKFDGVVGISNAIGGVDVCLAQPIVDPHTDLDLPAGDVSLKGWDALQFLRTRHGVGDGSDVSRISNQQVFMSALMRKLKSAETLSDPIKVWSLAKAAVDNMTLSESMKSVQFMQAAAGTVKDIDLENIKFVQYPTFAHPYEEGRLTPDYTSAQVLLDLVQSGESFDVAAVGEGAAVDTPEGTDAPPEAPPESTEVPPEGTEAPPTDGATPAGPVQLPDSITGQSAATTSCSAGRTAY
ncbi:MAG: LCP family protein [Leucobacter sp.]